MNRLKAIYIIRGKLVTVSGLHIGKGKDTIEIGGMDSPVMKHPHTNQPFIPGSSLKGKLRSLLEWYMGVVVPDRTGQGKPYDGGEDPTNHPIARIFGTTSDRYRGGPSRLIIRDAFLDTTWADAIEKAGLPFTEEKSETAIDRIQGSALTGSLRQLERVVPGAEFNVEFLYRIYELATPDGGATDQGQTDETHFQQLIPVGLKLLEMDVLGGGGSRGNGKIHFKDLTLQIITYVHQNGHIQESIEAPKEFPLVIPN